MLLLVDINQNNVSFTKSFALKPYTYLCRAIDTQIIKHGSKLIPNQKTLIQEQEER